MKLIVIAGPPTAGKTTVLKQVVKRLLLRRRRPAYLKVDVQFAEEDALFRSEFGIPARKIYSGELCPDHCNVLVLGDALAWARKMKAEFLLVETAGLCMRCSPYVAGSLGISVLEATSGMNLPRKVGPMLSLADMVVVTKIDLVSQAEREVFRAGILGAAKRILVVETNALYGIGIDPIVKKIEAGRPVKAPLRLRGSPPVGTCTICVGKKEIGWKSHFGVVRPLETGMFYRGE